MNLRRSLAALLPALLLASVLAPATALADIPDSDKAMARDLTVQGNDLLRARDYAAAADRFSRADKLFRAASTAVPPTISVGLARAYAALGKLVSAHELYSKVLHEPVRPNASPALLAAVDDAQREIAALTPRLPGVVINVKGTDAARVVLDGVDVPSAAWGLRRPTDPGRHVVHASAPGFVAAETTITLVEGKTETVTLEMRPGSGGPPLPLAPGATPEAEAPSFWTGMRVGGAVALGVGLVGIGVGSALGAAAISKKNQSNANCGAAIGSSDPNFCNATGKTARSDGLTAAGISTGAFVAGAVVLAGGVTLMAVGGRKSPQARVGVGPGSIDLSGTF